MRTCAPVPRTHAFLRVVRAISVFFVCVSKVYAFCWDSVSFCVHAGHFVCIFTRKTHPLANTYFPIYFCVFFSKGSFWAPACSQLDAIIGIFCKSYGKCIVFYLLFIRAIAGNTIFYVAWPTWVAESISFLRALCDSILYLCAGAVGPLSRGFGATDLVAICLWYFA